MNWSKREIMVLKDNFSAKTDNYVAKLLGKSPNAIRIKAGRLGIKKEMSYIRESLVLNTIEEQVILGGLLGDLHSRISGTSHYPNLQGAHGIKQKDYALWKVSLLHRLRFTLRITKINTFWYESKSFKALERYHQLFYPKGKKIVDLNILSLLNDFGLLIWYLDDGCFHKRDKNINLHTNGFSFEEQLIVQKWFNEKYHVHPKIYKQTQSVTYPGRIWYFLHFNANDSKILLAIFKQFDVPNCMKYKLGNIESHSTILNENKALMFCV